MKGRDMSMRQGSCFKLIGIAAAAALIAGCASETPKPDQFSGYLGNYSDMHEVSGAGLGTLFRWASPKLNPSNYNAVMIPPVQYYPRAEPNAQLSQQTLDAIRNYTTETLRRAAGEKVRVVTSPGRGVAKIQAAITGVKAAEQGLAAYQYIPIAFVVTMAKRSASGTPEDAKIVAEVMVTDSVSGEIIGKVVRVGTGKELAEATGGTEKVITLDDVKPIFDNWAEQTVQNITNFVRAK
jgi:hypothetical protein